MKKVTKELFLLQDKKYQIFSSKLVPNILFKNIIGVRTPDIRNLSKELSVEEQTSFLNDLPHAYLEENNLHMAIISNMKDINQIMFELDKFLPYVDNWSTCDTFTMKLFSKNKDLVSKKINEWLRSKNPYTIRYALVNLLKFYLDDDFDKTMLIKVSKINSDEYYVNMAIAWYYSYALIKQYSSTIILFENKLLSTWIHNKALQKAIESYRINLEIKDYLRSLKLK